MEKKRVKNKKKQIVAKLAGVTMMATTGIGIVSPLAGTIPGVISMAEGVQVESLTGTIDVSKQTTTTTDGIPESKDYSSNFTIDNYNATLKLNGCIKIWY